MRKAAVAGLAVLAGCTTSPAPVPPAPVTSVSFNLAGPAIDDPVAGPAIADQLASLQPDFAEVQECLCDDLLAKLPASYQVVDGAVGSEVGIVYASDRWEVLDDGVIDLGDADGWGTRVARWARMGYRGTSAEIYVYATHLCVPIRSTTDACDTQRQVDDVRRIIDDIHTRDAAVVLGADLNVFDGFEAGPVVGLLEQEGLIDTLRQVTTDPVTTFEGNSWAPPGRIDYVFATGPVQVLAADVAATSASDHRPVRATLQFE